MDVVAKTSLVLRKVSIRNAMKRRYITALGRVVQEGAEQEIPDPNPVRNEYSGMHS